MTSVMMSVVVCTGTRAVADEKGDANAELIKAIQALQAEVVALKGEVTAVRKDQARILTELNAIKRSQKPSQKRPKKKADTTVYNVTIGSSPFLGPKNAPVTIVEFVDVQCPFCGKEWPKIQQALKDYPKDVRVVFKHFPLSFHKQAKPAHAAMQLAAQKSNDAFWQMHDKILANRKDLAVTTLRKYAEQIGLDLQKFDEVMGDAAQIDALLAADMAEAKKCKVRGTPTVLINGLKLANRNPKGYKDRIDQILAAKKKGGK
ncbi:MAG: thioredoxin domain-containing protein [Phycisphaerae bacterium]|nr:thioredoxin domain-containing protein [Phycisphaerae bacterium]